MPDSPPARRPGTPSAADVKAEGQRLASELLEKVGKNQGDPSLQVNTATFPDFSKATAAVDDSGDPVTSGHTIVPTEGEMHPEGSRIPLEGSGNDTMARAIAEAAGEPAPAAAAPARDDATGRFKKEGAEDVDPAEQRAQEMLAQKAAKPAAKPAPAGEETPPAAAAPAAAADDEFVDVTYTDEDTGDTFVVKAPKAVAKRVEQGYMRRSLYHRNNTFLGESRPVLEPLAQSGQLRELLPLIKRAVDDQEFAQFVIEGYNRRISGLPLKDAGAPAAAAAPSGAAAAAVEPLTLSADEDPYMSAYLSPIQAELKELRQWRAEQQQTEQQRIESERAQRAAGEENARIVGVAHQTLAQQYSDEWTGNVQRDDQLIRRVISYAHNSGLFQQYGRNPATLILAYEHLREERAAAAASPAAAAMANAERTAATKVAQANAASVPAGTARTTSTPTKKTAPPLPPTRRDGQAVPISEFAAAALARVTAS